MATGVPPKGRAGQDYDYISPDGAEIRLILRPKVEGVAHHSVCEARFAPGQVSRATRHRTVEESWYVLEGEADVWRRAPGAPAADGTVTRIGPGDALNVPTGFTFQVRVTGSHPLRLLCSNAPPWPGPAEAIPETGGFGEPSR